MGRVNEIAQDELWSPIWCQFESLEKVVEGLIHVFVLTPNKYSGTLVLVVNLFQNS